MTRSRLMLVGLALALGCAGPRSTPSDQAEQARAPAGEKEPPKPEAAHAAPPSPPDRWAEARADMVKRQLAARDVDDSRVLAAMKKVPRHRFVPRNVRHQSYADHPLPIGHDVTISQPYIVGLMTQLADVEPGDRVLEVGTGSGYQAAVLAELGAEVYSIEIIEPLAKRAKEILAELGYDRVTVRQGDGYEGWPEKAPFDAIVVTAAPPRTPPPLKEQLKVGGKLVIPVGTNYQELVVITRRGQGYNRRVETPVRFVPMTGKAQQN